MITDSGFTPEVWSCLTAFIGILFVYLYFTENKLNWELRREILRLETELKGFRNPESGGL